ncbi:hypothetical protein [Peribacillus sp. SCS-37]|uniref:hypothetical protein n=1 Tax=Paraperibacillus esterisolvens TaxID=3115296 RepID=UPI00390625C3
MKKAVLLSIAPIFITTVLLTKNYFLAPSTVKAAVSEQINENSGLKGEQKYQIISVPDSLYTLVIFNIPHKIWIFKKQSLLGRTSYVFKDAFNTYESSFNKESAAFENGKLTYGLVNLPEGKTAYAAGEKLNVFPIGEYFSKSKYARDYKEIYFYYLRSPVKVKNEFTPLEKK